MGLFLLNGAVLKPKNKKGQIPKDVAEEEGHNDIVRFLESKDNLGTTRGGIGDAGRRGGNESRALGAG